MTQDSLIPANSYMVMGIVTGIHPPERTAKGLLTPARLDLDSQKYGKVRIAFFQQWVDKVRTENLPPEWEQIVKVQDWVMGKQIAVTASFKDIYGDITNFQHPVAVEFLDGDPPMIPEPVTPVTAASVHTPVATPQPQQWSNDPKSIQIAWNSAINNAVSRIPFVVEDPAVIDWDYISLWMTQVDALAWSIFHLIRRGALDPMVQPQETAEQSLFDEPTDLGLSGEII